MKKNKNQYVQANKDWLVAKSQEDGVKALPKGVYYKVLAEGDHSGAMPTPSSVITAHYTGKTIIGDRWEVYIPAEMGYGKFSQPGIPGGSTLIFDIELLAIN